MPDLSMHDALHAREPDAKELSQRQAIQGSDLLTQCLLGVRRVVS